MSTVQYVVGIDVGQSGVGITAIAVDPNRENEPTEILASVVHIIDGAKDPSSGKSPQSRLAVSGIARRARRLRRRKVARIKKLTRVLDDAGFVFGDTDPLAVTYEPWLARKHLIEAFVEDDAQRASDLRLAILHMARHRGWRNPWWSFSRLLSAIAPTEAFGEVQERAAEYLDVPQDALPTIGSIGALATGPEYAIRPRTADNSKAKVSGFSLLPQRIFQEDHLFELNRILEVQRVPEDTASVIREAVFSAKKPAVKAGLVGRDPFDKGQTRAPRSALEFQEYRIRSTIGNLRLRGLALDTDQRERVVDKLMAWTDPTAPTWDEVAEWLEAEGPELRFPSAEDAKSAKAPTMNTLVTLRQKKSTLKEVWAWWEREASGEQRAQFAAWLGDASENADSDLIEDFLESLSPDELTTLEATDGFGTGRAAYGRETLRRLNEAMRTGDGSLTTALQSEFGVDPNWKPVAPSLFEHIDHPVVDQVATVIGRALNSLVEQYGPPLSVNIEHVREAFFGPEALQEFKNEQSRNRNRRELVRAQLKAENKVDRVTGSDIRRYDAIQMQQGRCLYCGDTITFLKSEMDHIVARSIGGSNRRENLVAVCSRCNHEKHKQPFALWAARDVKADLPDAKSRVKEWQKPNGMSTSSFNALKRNVIIRLGRKSIDEPLDERAMATTAYAAREIADRIRGMFPSNQEVDAQTGEVIDAVKVRVFAGAATSEARKASGIDRMLNLRGIPQKSRLDRRHHAVDAAVIALMRPAVAKVLAERSELRRAEDSISVATAGKARAFRDYSGADVAEQTLWNRWKRHSEGLAVLMQQAVADDRIVVMRPLRLGSNVGRLHQDTISPLELKDAAESFTQSEVLRIADRETYLEAQETLNQKGELPEQTERDSISASSRWIGKIELFPGNAASAPTAKLAVRGGSAPIGDTLHHVRVYAIRKPSGRIDFKQLRVFAGEFGEIGFKKPGVDLFTHELPVWSQSVRCADPGLNKSIVDGSAHQIGWLVAGDELEFATPSEIIPSVLGFDTGRWHIPESVESRWVVTGFETNALINIKPAYLASEGLVAFDATEIPEPAIKVLGDKGWRASPNQVMQLNPNIIRRTALGRPRWRSENSMPTSWNVSDAVAKAFGDGSVAHS